MNKLDLHPLQTDPMPEPSDIELILSQPVGTGRETVRRLLVLVAAETDCNAITHRLWKLASSLSAPVKFLGLCKDTTQESALRRELITMASLLQANQVPTRLTIESGANWPQAVKRNYQAGDLIVCLADQRTGLWQRPLSQILESNLNATIYFLSGLPAQPQRRSTWLSQSIAWAGSLAILLLSFVLQIRLTTLAQDWAQTSLLILSVIGEFWLIWAWNNLFG